MESTFIVKSRTKPDLKKNSLMNSTHPFFLILIPNTSYVSFCF